MAQVTETTIERTVTEKGYQLTITEKEALTLLIILSYVSGHPDVTIRKYSGNIYDALTLAGLDMPFKERESYKEGSIHLVKDFE